jgi:phosphopantetheine--protein transferase-like protein
MSTSITPDKDKVPYNGDRSQDVAIIGMACKFPGAPDLDTFWQNIIYGVDATTDVPPERWDPDLFYDPDGTTNDRVYCQRGGYLPTRIAFNPLKYGIMPVAIDGGEPEQFLSLVVAHEALADAGYGEQLREGERTEVILGRGNYSSRALANIIQHGRVVEETLQTLRTLHPEYTEGELQDIKQALKAKLPNFSGENAPSLIPNLTTGRIANRLDLMGANFTIDAACASALVATEVGVRDLLVHKCDLVLAGGVYICPDVGFVSVFCQANALSRRAEIRAFDRDADGTLIGEGVGFVVLKRLEDALQDRDRIYAVIKGVGTSSDGRALSPLAPRIEGEELALQRAYEMAGLSPQTVQLIEAHGTGTPVGDAVEIQALSRVFGPRNSQAPWCALGTIKSMIGHAMPASGIAALIKTALALYHGVLPPTLHCDHPIPELDNSPFYVNTQTRPWIHGGQGTPRRAGVNAFGFGGINAHVVLEESPTASPIDANSHFIPWETEVCILQGESRQTLVEQGRRIQDYLHAVPEVSLKDLAYTLNSLLEMPYRLAILATSVADLDQKLTYALARLKDPQCNQIKDINGIYFFEEPLSRQGKLAFLFAGEGSQYVNMLSDLCLHFPEVRTYFDLMDQLAFSHNRPFVPSMDIFPLPFLSEDERQEAATRFWRLDRALEGIMSANAAIFNLLGRLEIQPNVIAGHSLGEWSALGASGVVDMQEFLQNIPRLYRIGLDNSEDPSVPKVALVAVGADRALVSQMAEQIEGVVYVANDNCPHQVLIAGEEEAIEEAIEYLKNKNIFFEKLPFNRGSHIPTATHICESLRQYFSSLKISAPKVELYSYCTAQPYPEDPAQILEIAVQSWVRPVEFRKTIEAMYESGTRIFVEVGPRGNLTAFVEDTLRGLPHLAVPSDAPRRPGTTQLNHLIGLLAAQGVPMCLDYLYRHRTPRHLTLDPSVDTQAPAEGTAGTLELVLGYPSMYLSERPPSVNRIETTRHSSHTLSENGSGAPLTVTPSRGQGYQEMGASQLPSLSAPQYQKPASPPAPGPSPVHATAQALDRLMQEHMLTMEQFLKTEQEIIESFLTGETSGYTSEQQHTPQSTPMPVSGRAEAARLPFIGEVISLTPGEELTVLRQVYPAEDIFLEDHTFGSRASARDKTLTGLPIIPMTASMEIMAEAASLLMPGQVLLGMKEVQAVQWIALEQGRTTLQVTARRRNSLNEVQVYLHDLGIDGETRSEKKSLVVQGIMVFGTVYPNRSLMDAFSLASPRPCLYTAEAFYGSRGTFHGPRFHGVVSLDQSGDDGLAGQLQVLPSTNLFQSTAEPFLLTDFALLDAVGQLLGYWCEERLESGYVVFPFRLEALDFYRPGLPAGARTRCQLRIQEVSAKHIRADMDVVGPDGQLWMRLTGWTDWRFYWSEKVWNFQRFPAETLLCQSWDTPISSFPEPTDFTCFILDQVFDFGGVENTVWSHVMLNHREREVFRNLGGPKERQTQWLMGRAAAKDAARAFLEKRHGLSLSQADIEIAQDKYGRPEIGGLWHRETPEVPLLSLSHTRGLAVAIVGQRSGQGRLGVDLQEIEARNPAFERMAFSPEERSLLDSLGDEMRDEWITRFWCAKEAVAKALGRGLVDGPQGLSVMEVAVATGTVRVTLEGTLAAEFPEFAGIPLVAYTFREGNYAVASTLCEKGLK